MSKKHGLITEDVRKMTGEELGIELARQRDRLYTLRTQAVTEKIENPSEFAATRKNVARLLTEQTARRSKAAAK